MTNRIAQALGDGAKKLGKTLGEDAGKAAKDLYHDTGKRLKRVADNHSDNDSKVSEKFERLAKRPRNEETPIYHLDDHGNVRRLNHDPNGATPGDRYKLDELTAEDTRRLGFEPSSVGSPTEGERLALLRDRSEGMTRPRPTTASTQVAPGSTDLARATQLAHHADNYYPTSRSGRNYAALRARGADGGGDFILVGRSHPSDGTMPKAHSERMLGMPFLRQGQGGRISELYTERAPCSESANCSAWMAERLPHVQASHSFEYGATRESRAAGNAAIRGYLTTLKAAR